ncbi:MAG: hypothetical protein JXQ73_12250 [Phycisphaerae bacterium]|nr:hypothetical protein [Phycisphaerae bacterium]
MENTAEPDRQEKHQPTPAAEDPGPPSPCPTWRHHAAAGGLYLVLTIALTWPLAAHVADKVAVHPKLTMLVPFCHLYQVAWNHHALDRGLEGFWDCNIFYPHPRVLTYFESLFVPAWATWPIHRLTHNATLCYNLIVLTAFILNALAAYALALQMRLSWRLAVLVGSAVAFCPYLFEEIYCLPMLMLYPAAFLLAATHRLLSRPTWGATALAGLCGLWLVTSCYQYALFASLLCLGWVVWFVRDVPWRRLWYRLLAVGVVCGALVYPLLSTVKRTHRDMGFYHGPSVPMHWLQMLIPASHQWLYADVLGIEVRTARGDLDPIVCFPGIALAGLAAVGAGSALFSHAESRQDRRRRHAYRFCLIASLLSVLLAMGIWIQLGPVRVPGPYALLMLLLSPFSSVRSVYRFYVFGHLFAAVLAGVGLGRCLELASTGRGRTILGAAVALLILIESLWIPLNLEPVGGRPTDVHPLYAKAAELDPNAPMIEVPVPQDVRRAPLDALYTAASIHTWQPIVNGYASYYPGLYEELRPVMAEFPSSKSIAYLRALGVRFVLVRGLARRAPGDQSIQAYPSLRKIDRSGQDVLYELADTNRRSLNDRMPDTTFQVEPDPGSKRVAIGRLTFKLGFRDVIPVLPGDRGTRWTLTWRNAADQTVRTQVVRVRNSHWLTKEKNVLQETVELPAAPGPYTIQAVDQRDGRTLGACSFDVK